MRTESTFYHQQQTICNGNVDRMNVSSNREIDERLSTENEGFSHQRRCGQPLLQSV